MRRRIAPALLALSPLLAVAAPAPSPTTSLDAGAAARFAALGTFAVYLTSAADLHR